jgi:hypothetical protein
VQCRYEYVQCRYVYVQCRYEFVQCSLSNTMLHDGMYEIILEIASFYPE